jgi:hypothetical protein
MKCKFLLLACLLLIIPFAGTAQVFNRFFGTTENYYQLVDSGRAYYQEDTITIPTNKYGYKSYKRWETFWADRVFNNDTTVGSMSYRSEHHLTNRSSSTLCNNSGNVTLNDNWTANGPFTLSTSYDGTTQWLGMITAVAAKPGQTGTIDEILVGSAMGGIFRTTDEGATWTCVTDDLNLPGLGIGDIVYHPTNAGHVFAGTGHGFGRNYGAGLLYSTDYGVTWDIFRLTTNQDDPPIRKILVDANNTNKVYVLAGFSLYVFTISTGVINEISAATLPSTAWQAPFYNDMEIVPGSNPTILFLSTAVEEALNGGAKLYRIVNPLQTTPTREDVSSTLNTSSGLEAIAVEACSANSNQIYIMGVGGPGDVNLHFEKCTTANATTLTFIGTGNCNRVGQSITFFKHPYDLSNSNPDIFYVGGTEFSKSTNAGSSIFNIEGGHDDIRDVLIYSSSSDGLSDKVIVGNDGGISISYDGFQTNASINGSGLNTNLFYGVDVNDDLSFFGFQDGYGLKYDGTNWDMDVLVFGDATHCIFDRVDPQKIIASDLYGDVYYKSTDQGSTHSAVSWPSEVGAYWGEHEPYVHSSNTYFIGLDELYIVDDPYGTPCWKRISNFRLDFNSFGHPIRTFAVSESDMGRAYVALHRIVWDANASVEGILFRSTLVNDVYVWEDITDNIWQSLHSNVLRRCQITDIEISPDDPDKIWITFGNFVDSDETERVFYSSDGGDTWIDYSEGLPNYPVNKIIYQNGVGRDQLYLANDIGVYFRDETGTQWECYSTNLPVCIVKDLAIDYTNGRLYAATFGRGSFVSPLTNSYSAISSTTAPTVDPATSGTVSITGTVVWENALSIDGDLEIMPGASLTIKNKVSMKVGKKITVHRGTSTERGGRLYIQGGEITVQYYGTCTDDNMWKGIEVLGYPNESQFPLSTTKQGFVEITSEGKISLAETGVVLGKLQIYPMSNSLQFAGGIIQVRNGIFQHCQNDVVFLKYTNFITSPSNPVANASYFDNCTFETNPGNLLGPPVIINPIHVTLFGVDGIRFTRCLFKNIAAWSGTNPANNQTKGIGIFSLNSSFKVLGACNNFTPDDLPCSVKNQFIHLTYGIYATSTDPTKAILIKGNEFDCYHNVFLNGINYPTVTLNHFSILNLQADVPNNLTYGLHLNQCSNYEIENNFFQGLNGHGSQIVRPKVALQISLPDNQSESVYNNTFEDIGNGYCVFVQGLATDTDPTPTGLQILCNDFRMACKAGTTQSGYAEVESHNIFMTQNGKISATQGSAGAGVSDPAGNTFQNLNQGTAGCTINKHESCSVGGTPYTAEINTYFGLNSSISYYHHIEDATYATEPSCYSTNVIPEITIHDYNKIEACPTQFGTDNSSGLLRGRIDFYFGLTGDLISVIDNNQGSVLIDYIEADSSDGFLKEKLMDASPYLSDSVLRAVINDKPTPMQGDTLFIILTSNSPLSEDVWDAVVNRIPALSTTLMDSLRDMQNGISERSKLFSEIEQSKLRYFEAINDLTRNFLLADTVQGYLDSVKAVFIDYNVADWKLASVYAAEKDYTNAFSVIDNYLTLNSSDNQAKLARLAFELDTAAGWWDDADSTQLVLLEQIKDAQSFGAFAANGVQYAIWDTLLLDERIVDTTVGHRPIYLPDETTAHKVSKISIRPNPANEWVIFEFNAEDGKSMVIFGIDGKVMYEGVTMGGFFYLDSNFLPNGMYFICIKNEIGLTTEKFVINH